MTIQTFPSDQAVFGQVPMRIPSPPPQAATMTRHHYLKTDDAGQLWLHLESPSGATAALCLSSLVLTGQVTAGGVVDNVFREFAAILATEDGRQMFAQRSEPSLPRYARQAPDGTWEGADHLGGPWQAVPIRML